MRLPAILAFALGASTLFTGLSRAQAPSTSLASKASSSKAAAVTYLFPEQVTIAAGKPSAVDLHFRIAPGLHINSHFPHEEEYIPTTLKLEDPAVTLKNAGFPPGTDVSFAIDPNEKLSVYTGDFVVRAELIAAPGEHLVQALLHYQACDNSACMPPHTIPVVFDVIAR
jgi:hypothetical protein